MVFKYTSNDSKIQLESWKRCKKSGNDADRWRQMIDAKDTNWFYSTTSNDASKRLKKVPGNLGLATPSIVEWNENLFRFSSLNVYHFYL